MAATSTRGSARSWIGIVPAARPLGWRQVAGIMIVTALIVPPLAAMQLQRRPAAAAVVTLAPTPPALPQSAAQDSRELHGIVLGPDGRPFAGARLYVPYEDSRGHKFLEKGQSGPDGRFRFTVSRRIRRLPLRPPGPDPSRGLVRRPGHRLGEDGGGGCQRADQSRIRPDPAT